MIPLTIETAGSSDFGPCGCCSANSRTVWGYLHRGDVAEAAYFVQWTLGQIERHGANFDLIVGKWGDGTSRNDRSAISLEFHWTDRGPAFTVVDSLHRPFASSDLVGTVLSRDEVVGTPLAQLAFEFIDAIWLHDERIGELTTVTHAD